MTLSNIVKTGHDAGVLKLTDNAGTPKELTIRYDKADFKLGNVKPSQRETVVIAGRGKLRSLRKGAPIYPTLTFSLQVTDLTEGTTGTLPQYLAKTGPFTGRASTLSAIGDVDTISAVFTQEGTTYGDSQDGVIEVTHLHVESWEFSEAEDGNTISVTCTVYGDVEFDGELVASVPRVS